MENKGKLIVLESAFDGVGKSTQLEMIKRELGSDNCVTWEFPSKGLASSAMVRSFLKGKLGPLEEIPDEVAETYYAIDREYVWRNYLKAAYEQGKTVVLDRYTTSGFIYQTLKSATDLEKLDMISKISSLEYNVLKMGEPDKVIFLNGDFDTLNNARLALHSDPNDKDIFEKQAAMQRKIYESAQFACEYLKWCQVNMTENGVMRSDNDINKDVMRLVRSK